MLKIVVIILALFTSGCVTTSSFRQMDGEQHVEKILTHDARNNRNIEVDLVIHSPKKFNSNLPAIIFLSGCDGGHWEVHQTIARNFNRLGVVIAEVKSIEAFGNQCLKVSLSGSERAGQAFIARDHLASKGLANPDNVAIFGLSHGGWSAVAAAQMTIQPFVFEALAYKNPFKAAVGLYPWCETWLSKKPIESPFLILGGTDDTWTPVDQCARALSHDKSVEIHVYKGATHAWDAPFPGRTAPTQKGSTFMAYDAKATKDSIARASNFLKEHLKID